MYLYKFLPYSLGRGFFKIFLLPPRRVVYTQRTSMDIIINFLYDWGYLALFICMALENMNVPIPSEIILLCRFSCFSGNFLVLPTIAIGTAAGIAGSVASYYMGYKADADSY